TTRSWNDANGDYFPQATELGPLANSKFGTVVAAKRYDPEILKGWYVRPYIWQTSASVSHELRKGFGVSVGYFRTTFGNFRAVDDLALTPNDFDPFCVTTPVNAALPGGGGQRICGLYDVKPSKFGQSSLLVTKASNFGEKKEIYDGVEV